MATMGPVAPGIVDAKVSRHLLLLRCCLAEYRPGRTGIGMLRKKGESREASSRWWGSGGVPQLQFSTPFLARKGAGGWSKGVLPRPVRSCRRASLFNALQREIA